MKKRRSRAIPMSDETRSRIRIVAAQSYCDEEDVVKAAVDLLYAVVPADRDARINLDALKSEIIEKLNECGTEDDSDRA